MAKCGHCGQLSSEDPLAKRIRGNIARLEEAIDFQAESVRIFSKSKAPGSKEAARLARNLLAKYRKELSVEKTLYKKLTGRGNVRKGLWSPQRN